MSVLPSIPDEKRVEPPLQGWSAIRSTPLGLGLECLLVAFLYFAAGRLGLAIPFTSGNVSPVWPAAGVALAAALILGPRIWPGIALGAFLVNFFTPIPHLAAAGLMLGNALGPTVGALLIKRKPFARIAALGDVVRLIMFGGIGAAISATLGTTVLFLTGVQPWRDFTSAWLIWWLGDSMGVLLVAPLLINLRDVKMPGRRIPELLLLIIALFASSALLFRGQQTEEIFGFAILPFIIWASLRFGIAGAALANCIVSGSAIWTTGHAAGPFVRYGPPLYNAGILQMFIAVLSLSGLALAAVVSERQTVRQALAREEMLRKAQDLYRNIVETTNDGVWIIDQDHRTTFVNRRMAEMLGHTVDELLGHSLFEFMFAEDVPQKQGQLQRRRQGIREVFYERYRTKSGAELWALVSAAPLEGPSGKFSGSLAMASDATMLRKTEEALRRNEKLITAGKLAATISHEVNNPLGAALNLLYLLRNEQLSGQGTGYLKRAEQELLRVAAITKRTLGFFRDTSAPVAMSFPELLDDTLSLYEPQFTQSGIGIIKQYRTSAKIPLVRGEIQQVFANLFSNALDAMAHGGVLILRVFDHEHDGTPGIQVDVEDTGSGIQADHLNKIFEPFFTTKENTGTGLGLWVAKEIVTKYGGTISVKSRSIPDPQHGTQFSLYFPGWKPANSK